MAAKSYSYVILVCLSLLIFVLNKKPRRRTNIGPGPGPGPTRSRSFIIREIHSGYSALNRLVTDKYERAGVNPSALDSADTLRKELEQEFPDLAVLQHNVEELEMSRKEDDAEKILRKALKKVNDEKKPHESYEIEMLLVEVLIYKGENLEEALNSECLGDESLKDARRPLYKAIIYKMEGNKEKAKEHWGEFIVVRDPAFSREIDFDQFEHHVDRLQNAIQKVAAKGEN